jgi:hypothetical protein
MQQQAGEGRVLQTMPYALITHHQTESGMRKRLILLHGSGEARSRASFGDVLLAGRILNDAGHPMESNREHLHICVFLLISLSLFRKSSLFNHCFQCLMSFSNPNRLPTVLS